jgi:phospholipid/cholesterol/gamma-HCH transport system permease protein
MNYVVASRVIATTIMVPVLVLVADALALFGSYIAVNMEGEMAFNLFFHNALRTLSLSDFVPAVIKTFFFGFFIGLIGSYKGYYAGRGTEAVGRAANQAVVMASLVIFILDLFVVQITNLINTV